MGERSVMAGRRRAANARRRRERRRPAQIWSIQKGSSELELQNRPPSNPRWPALQRPRRRRLRSSLRRRLHARLELL